MTDAEHYDAIRTLWAERYTFATPAALVDRLARHFRAVDARSLPADVETVLLAATALPALTRPIRARLVSDSSTGELWAEGFVPGMDVSLTATARTHDISPAMSMHELTELLRAAKRADEAEIRDLCAKTFQRG